MDILGISELKWMGMGEFDSDDCGQESLRRNGAALTVNRRVQNGVIRCNLKKGRMISVHFQGKPFKVTVIQVYAPTTGAKEAEVDWFYKDLQEKKKKRPTRPSRTNTKQGCPFHLRGQECKSRKSRDIWSNGQVWPWNTKQSRAKVSRILSREHTGYSKHFYLTT